MNSSAMKAREIEALVYIEDPQPTGAQRNPRRLRLRAERAAATGLAAVVVVAAALAWWLLHS